jgi:4-amino-4-deoxy-L-arabinose transferase-like glycosyltransferase
LLTYKEAVTGGWLLVFSLGPLVYSLYILTETLFIFLVVVFLLCLSQYAHGFQTRWLVVCGIACGLAILCRPVGVFLPLIGLIFLVYSYRAHTRRMFLSLAMVGLSTSLIVLPWMIRNYLQFGIFTVSTVSAYNMYFYNAAALEADLKGISQDKARMNMNAALESQLSDSPAAPTREKVQLMRMLSRDAIEAHPWRYAYIHLRNSMNSLLPNLTEMMELLGITQGDKGTLSVLNQDGLVAAIQNYFGRRTWLLWMFTPMILLLVLEYIGALVGGVYLVKHRDWGLLILLVLPVLFLLLIPGPASHPRFRVPAMPMITLLAGLGLTELTCILKSKWEHP